MVFRFTVSLCLLVGCDFSASTAIWVPDTASTDSGDAAVDDGADGGSTGSDTGAGADARQTDDDGDGVSEADGDCDDTDPSIAPGVVDGCDGIDEDCDGEVDEDAPDEDPHEPNDTTATALGVLTADTVLSTEARLHDDSDIDRYAFSFEDSGWNLFRLEVGLANVPDGARYQLRLENAASGAVIDGEVSADGVSIVLNDTVFVDEGGDWEAVVSSEAGADCARLYLLTVRLFE